MTPDRLPIARPVASCRLAKPVVRATLGLALLLTALFGGSVRASDRLPSDDDSSFETRLQIFPGMARGFLLYREIALALIDQRKLATLGPADQAADAFGIMMLTNPDGTPVIDAGYAASRLYWLQTHQAPTGADPAAMRARYSRILCLVIGANAAKREQLGRDNGMSWHEVYACTETYRRAAAVWRGALGSSRKPFYPVGSPSPFRFEALPPGRRIPIPDDVRLGIPLRLNKLGVDLTLPKPTPIVFRSCGEPATHYDPAVPEIVFCYEMLPELDRLATLLR